jgi:hypothetical protein
MAILTGGNVVTEDLGVRLDTLKISDLGTATRVKVEKEKCTIVGGGGDKKQIGLRIEELRASGIMQRVARVGQAAPDFTLPNATGGAVRLADLRALGPVVLSFYRGRW